MVNNQHSDCFQEKRPQKGSRKVEKKTLHLMKQNKLKKVSRNIHNQDDSFMQRRHMTKSKLVSTRYLLLKRLRSNMSNTGKWESLYNFF